jgi:hypothetical protein
MLFNIMNAVTVRVAVQLTVRVGIMAEVRVKLRG